MSKILVNELVNLAGNDKITFPEGAKVSSGETLDLNGATITLSDGVGLNNQLLASSGSGLKWVTFTDTNSAYAFASVNAAANDVKLRLTGSGDAVGQQDQVTFTGAGSVTLAENAGVVTVTGVDTNTTYDLLFADITDGASVNLSASTGTSDLLLLKGGNNITITRNANEITFSTALAGTVGAPSTVTDNSIALFDGTDGSLLSDSALVLDSSNNLTGLNSITTAADTASLISFYYADVASFPAATSRRGSFAFAQATSAMHYAAGNSWYQIATLGDIIPNTDTTYSIALTGSDFGELTLADSNGIEDDVYFRSNTYGGVEVERSTETLYFDSRLYSISAESGGGNFVYLRLTGENHDRLGAVTTSTTDNITIAGADGLTVERTDANTITLRQGGGNVSQYTDDEAKDAAAQSLLNGSHTGIAFSYDSANKILSATASGGGGGGGGSSILYDFSGTTTTSNHVVLNLVPSSGATDTVELAGGGETTIAWDSVNKKATISSPSQIQPDWNATSGLGEILNKPTIPSAYTLPAATTTTIGGVSAGTGIDIQPSGEIQTSLQIITDASNSTTNDLSAAGFTLNTNYTTVTGATGDIKRINDLPHYHDGTDWRPFYLTGTAQQAVSSDVNFDDVQVRMDFAGPTAFNRVNELTAAISYQNTGGTADVSVVTSPVKYGTHALKIFNLGGTALQDRVYWSAQDNSARSSIWGDGTTNRHFWWNAKRGGCLDWAQDWTVEFWIRWDSFGNGVNDDTGVFHVYDLGNIGGGSFGLQLRCGRDSNGNPIAGLGRRLTWLNYRTTDSATDTIVLEDLHAYTLNTWYFISLTFDASTGQFLLHRDGTNVTAGTPTDLNMYSANGSDGNTYETVLGSFRSQSGQSLQLENKSDAYWDDIRFTQFARYDSNDYTAPTDTLPITADAPPTVDPDWSNVIIRNTFDTNVNDISQYAVTPTSHSDASIQTTNVKYGAGALRMASVAGYIEHYDFNSNFDPSGTFTAEFWINWDAITAGNGVGYVFNTIWSQTDTAGNNDYAFGLGYTTNVYNYLGVSGNAYRFFWRNSGTISYLHSDSIPSAIILGNYNHVALVRDANGDMRVYFNGYKLRFDTADTTVFSDTQITYEYDADFRIGAAQDDFSNGSIQDFGFYGYIDDFRITNDVKYTDNFTPPSGPLPITGTVTSDPGTPTSSVTGLATRDELTGSVTLAADATGDLNITGYKAYSLLKIETDADAWVRVYTDAAARTADATRSEGEDPGPGDGVIAEVRGNGVIRLSPAPFGYNNDSPNVGDTIYTTVTNRSGSSATINVTLTAIRLEA